MKGQLKITHKAKLHSAVILVTDYPTYREKFLIDNKIKQSNIKKEFHSQYVGLEQSAVFTSERKTVVYMIWTIIYFE